jgi:16S rRNA (adenine1518-N6/adenine1519-N6)-dimethyltransferase
LVYFCIVQYTLKKSLGQHFLKDERVCERILSAVQNENPIRLVEVGPGGGALTKFLLTLKEVDFRAIEVDREKVDYLLNQYPSLKDKLLHESILEATLPFTDTFVLVGNFPYNISSQIVFRILDWKEHVTSVIGMFQKEVAQRIVAKEGSKTYGILSVLVQAYYEAFYLFDVAQQAFVPPPQVMSGVLLLKKRIDIPDMKSERLFFLLVKTAFNQRRKMLRNAVRSLFSPEVLEDPIFNQRAEQLSVRQFADLTFRMNGSTESKMTIDE